MDGKDVAGPPAEGLRRSKRNKYHLDVASLLLSSSSTIRRDLSPPTATKKTTGANRKQLQPAGEEEMSKMAATAPRTRERQREKGAKKGEEEEVRGNEEEKERKKSEEEEELESEGEKEQCRKKLQQSEPETRGEPPAAATTYIQPQTRSISGGAPRHAGDIQLPDQLLEEEPYDESEMISPTKQNVPEQALESNNNMDITNSNRILRQTVRVLRSSDPGTVAPESGESMCAEYDPQNRKRKRKVAPRGGDRDEDEQLFGTVKVEYTVPAEGANMSARDHPCPKCPAVFDSRVGLTNHLKLHGSKKEFPCELCDFSCTNKKTMRCHRRVHGLSRRPRRSHEMKCELKPKLEELSPGAGKITPPPKCADMRELVRGREFGEMDKRRKMEEAERDEEDEEEEVEDEEEGEDESEGQGMPVLEQQEDAGGGVEEGEETVGEGGDGEDEQGNGRNMGRGGGTRSYDRNTVGCPHCPFRTQSKQRLEPHLNGHNRPSGFVCSCCGFKSESSGFVRRHSQLHKEACKWPPDYVGVPDEQIAKLVENARQQREGQSEAENLQGSNPKEEGKRKKKGTEKPGGTKVDSRKLHETRKLSRQNPHFSARGCIRCGLRCHSNLGHLELHKIRHHRLASGKRLALCRELLTERLAWRDDRGMGTELEWGTGTMLMAKQSPDVDGDESNSSNSNITTNTESNQGRSTSSHHAQGAAASKTFRCRSCPFGTDQIFRLQKHENKHLVKSEHQCPVCSFSCRSLDILAQHTRLHDQPLQQSVPSPSPQSSAASAGPRLLPTAASFSSSSADLPKLAPIRRNEAHYCPHCPYSSKHNCDMKAHMKMHEERRKFACSFCTYSTKRQNALIAHEQLHRKGPLLGSPAVLGTRGAKCRRLKRIIGEGSHLLGEQIRFEGARTHFYRCALGECRQEMAFCADLARHARHHLPEWARTRTLQCPKCRFGTNLRHRMEAHQGAAHNRAAGTDEGREKNAKTDAGIFKCKECPFATVNYAKFWNHRQKHKRANRFTCTLCSFSSGSAQCYADHMILHGDGGEQKAPKWETKSRESNDDGEENADEKRKKTRRNEGQEEERDDDQKGRETEGGKPQGRRRTPPEECQNGGGRSEAEERECNGGGQQQRRSMDLPPFQKDKFDQLSAALPSSKQIKMMMGNDDQEADVSGTINSYSNMRSCPQCPFETPDRVLLRLHSVMHRSGTPRPFNCTLCSFSCFSAESLHIHLSLHASATSLESAPNDGTGATVSSVPSTASQPLKGGSSTTAAATPWAFQCSQCTFKCGELEQFLAHRKEHVQLLQQRLMTIIKRSSTGDNLLANGGSGAATARGSDKLSKGLASGRGTAAGGGSRSSTDKQHYCPRCSFRCDTVQAFTRHWEHHRIDGSRPGHFRCTACDYSSDTHNVVLFHERNHHLDIPLSSLCRNIEINLITQQNRPNDGGTGNSTLKTIG